LISSQTGTDTENSQGSEVLRPLFNKKTRHRVCQPNQGKLNQLIATAKMMMVAHGHTPQTFVRDYTKGTAVSCCLDCSESVTVDAIVGVVGGVPLISACEKINL
jgi:hypothetical protein